MKNFYEVGKVYIWQNQVGDLAHFNGTECTVIGEAEQYIEQSGALKIGHLTDSMDDYARQHDCAIYAELGDLRPKNPPKGEQSVRDLFKLPELETA